MYHSTNCQIKKIVILRSGDGCWLRSLVLCCLVQHRFPGYVEYVQLLFGPGMLCLSMHIMQGSGSTRSQSPEFHTVPQVLGLVVTLVVIQQMSRRVP